MSMAVLTVSDTASRSPTGANGPPVRRTLAPNRNALEGSVGLAVAAATSSR